MARANKQEGGAVFPWLYKLLLLVHQRLPGVHVPPLWNDNKWHWGMEEQSAFDKLKQNATSAPVLISPNLKKLFCIEADSSNFTTGAIPSQVSPDNDKWHLVTFVRALMRVPAFWPLKM